MLRSHARVAQSVPVPPITGIDTSMSTLPDQVPAAARIAGRSANRDGGEARGGRSRTRSATPWLAPAPSGRYT